MQEFDAIRPYKDEEVEAAVGRLLSSNEMVQGMANLRYPKLSRVLSLVANVLTRWLLRARFGKISTVDQVQQVVKRYMQNMISNSIESFTVGGLTDLSKDRGYLFISNHRDIVLDSGLLNFALNQEGYNTSRIAVGDNLMTEQYVEDMMRLNKSFIVQRSVAGNRQIYAALSRTSNYIRHSLQESESVWIAQRQGRAKDGNDRTDPALVKMLTLSYRKDELSFAETIARLNIVPVSISYELDPCDLLKAHELYQVEQEGSFDKGDDDDLSSIAQGILGYKGRVHIQFGSALNGSMETPEDVAELLDRQIIGGLSVFPTHVAAARLQGVDTDFDDAETVPRVMETLEAKINQCADAERPFLIAQYANIINNKHSLNQT